ncbi:MAG TPA: tyrosine-type recombinase/integrase [Burkholderiales bacterium]|nr:tyrosine-type recombinase/integrase [Burkholderiales bacterium]
MITPVPIAGLLERFFTERLMRERQASSHTIAAYRDTFRLLLAFVHQRLGKAPCALTLADLDATLIGAFLDHLERSRGNSARTRNARLAAIHSFFGYVALQEPTHAGLIQRALAMPNKRYDRRPIDFLTREEMEALLAAPDRGTWIGRRDHALLLLALQTGLRVSELIGLRCDDVVLGSGAHVRCRGKGRKERCTPLRRDAVAALRLWLRERAGRPEEPLFPSGRGATMSRDAIEYLLAKYAAAAQKRCPSLQKKRVSPHVLRHSTAMDLLQRGIDRSVIALWLGHESVETTQMYLDADLALKEKALARTAPLPTYRSRYRPDDRLMAFLRAL